jgi:hypothetical protein
VGGDEKLKINLFYVASCRRGEEITDWTYRIEPPTLHYYSSGLTIELS